MHYTATADTDVGIAKANNQDSVLIKHASTDIGEVLMAIVCDGMGGASGGQIASTKSVQVVSDRPENDERPGFRAFFAHSCS